MIFNLQDCWVRNHLKAEDHITRQGHSFHGSNLERRQRDLSKLMERIWGLLIWAVYTLQAQIKSITPMEALYKLSRIVQMKLVIIIRSKWVEILVLSWSHKGELVSKKHFLDFLLLEVLLPFRLFFVVAGCSLAFHLSKALVGPVVDPGWHIPHLRNSLLHSQHCTLTCGAQICFDPTEEYHLKHLILKLAAIHETCFPEGCSKSPSMITSVHFSNSI